MSGGGGGRANVVAGAGDASTHSNTHSHSDEEEEEKDSPCSVCHSSSAHFPRAHQQLVLSSFARRAPDNARTSRKQSHSAAHSAGHSAAHCAGHPHSKTSNVNVNPLMQESQHSDIIFSSPLFENEKVAGTQSSQKQKQCEPSRCTGRFGSMCSSKYATVCTAEHLRALLAGEGDLPSLSCALSAADERDGRGDRAGNCGLGLERGGAVERRPQSRSGKGGGGGEGGGRGARAEHRASWSAPAYAHEEEYANLMKHEPKDNANPNQNPNQNQNQNQNQNAKRVYVSGNGGVTDDEQQPRQHPRLDYKPSLRGRTCQKETQRKAMESTSSSGPASPVPSRKCSSPYPEHSTLRPSLASKGSSPNLRTKEVHDSNETEIEADVDDVVNDERVGRGTASVVSPRKDSLRVDLRAASCSPCQSGALAGAGAGVGVVGSALAEPSSATTCSSNESTLVPKVSGSGSAPDGRSRFSRLPTYPAVRS